MGRWLRWRRRGDGGSLSISYFYSHLSLHRLAARPERPHLSIARRLTWPERLPLISFSGQRISLPAPGLAGALLRLAGARSKPLHLVGLLFMVLHTTWRSAALWSVGVGWAGFHPSFEEASFRPEGTAVLLAPTRPIPATRMAAL